MSIERLIRKRNNYLIIHTFITFFNNKRYKSIIKNKILKVMSKLISEYHTINYKNKFIITEHS